MNTPNKLTIFRIILAPIFLWLLLWEQLPHRFFISCLVFAAAAITDLVDGKMARKNNQITTFGKFLDPLADKLLTTGALLGFMQLGLCNIWIIMIVLAREFIVTSVRLVASGSGRVIAANIWGKVKTVSQMVVIILILLMKEVDYIGFLPKSFPLTVIASVLLWFIAAATAVSGVKYVWDNRKFVNGLK